MRIDPTLIIEFREWMRVKYASATEMTPEQVAAMVELRGFITMMKSAQWPILADIADHEESDVVGTVEFDPDELMELDEYEQPFYEEFLRSCPIG